MLQLRRTLALHIREYHNTQLVDSVRKSTAGVTVMGVQLVVPNLPVLSELEMTCDFAAVVTWPSALSRRTVIGSVR